jgi:hypothetical protein
MKRYIIGIIILLLVTALGVLIYFLRIDTHYIDLGTNQIDDVVDMHFFEGVVPLMSKQDVIAILGNTTQIYEESEGGEKYERWTWGRAHGIINYYFEPTEDGGIGSPEFLPNNLKVDELFFKPLQFDLELNKKHLIEIKGKDKRPFVTVRTFGKTIKRINYYCSKDEPQY